MLAENEVMWRGEPICAVVAESEDIAREAANLVELDIEELPPILTAQAALDAAAKEWDAITDKLGRDKATVEPSSP